MARIVAFDEAGNTGEDLLNRDQPVFTLASVLLPPEVALELTHHPGKEFHFRTARKSQSGRAAILHVLTDSALSSKTVRTVAIHKRFAVVAKMVDLLVEPLAARSGFDLLAEGTHLALSNLLYATLPAMLGSDSTERLLLSFVAMCRDPTKAKRAKFVLTLRDLSAHANERVRGHLRTLAAGAALGEFGGTEIPDLDPAPTCLHSLAVAWAGDGERFGILHDDRKELKRWEPFLAMFWRASAEPETFVLFDGRPMTYPLPVTGLNIASSQADARLQVADIVAGSLQFVLNEIVGIRRDSTFATTLRNETPLMSWVVDGNVWPTLDMSPAALGVQPGATPNLADALATWISRKR